MDIEPHASPDKLRDLVTRHRIVYELRPAYVMTDRGRVQIGFDVELYGTHAPSAQPKPTPGCPQCQAVWDDMRKVALAALPTDRRKSIYTIERFEPAFHYASARQPPGGSRPDVQLTIDVRHREEFLADVDICEDRCAQEITHNLRRFGVQEHIWRRT